LDGTPKRGVMTGSMGAGEATFVDFVSFKGHAYTLVGSRYWLEEDGIDFGELHFLVSCAADVASQSKAILLILLILHGCLSSEMCFVLLIVGLHQLFPPQKCCVVP
jgi:hypothetical protein